MNEDVGEPLILWEYQDGAVDETVELWGEDTDGDYRLTIRGQHTMWVPASKVEDLAWAIIKDRLRR